MIPFLDWSNVEKDRIHLVWIAILITGGLVALELRRRDAIGAFLSPLMQKRLAAQAGMSRAITRLVMIFLATLTATLVTNGGRSAWFLGVLLLMVYLVFALTLYLLPPMAPAVPPAG